MRFSYRFVQWLVCFCQPPYKPLGKYLTFRIFIKSAMDRKKSQTWHGDYLDHWHCSKKNPVVIATFRVF